MCGGGAALGAVVGALLAPATGGASLALGAGLGAAAGNALIDQPKQLKQAAEAQSTAANQAVATAQQQVQQAQEAMVKATTQAEKAVADKAMPQRPDSGAMLSAGQQAVKGGAGLSTMLTGPQGVDLMNLGKNTLLGS